MKKIVIKVNINCQICKTEVLKAVTKLTGIDKVSVDGEKGMLTIVGDVDPVLVVRNLKKIGKVPEIISVGPPKPPEYCEEFKFRECRPCPPSCKECQLIFTTYPYINDGRTCSIL
ncbi:heavy metal-associated isoprenylated plant protein 2-like [Quercus robur]|uniref:heavy metal-associated isoprenylated plant protein 2-like n=1 Tax=Quercus robur TaxID=38942 RepID=UPI002162C04A|nr:heavy metal-associated isoprenylated plant protein 2-like [Quercus robur]